MFHYTNQSQSFLNLRGLSFVFAWVLAIAILMAQLHTLEHAESSEEDNNDICLICILGSDLDAGDIPTTYKSVVVDFSLIFQTVTNYRHKPVYAHYAFQGRAPPPTSSIT